MWSHLPFSTLAGRAIAASTRCARPSLSFPAARGITSLSAAAVASARQRRRCISTGGRLTATSAGQLQSSHKHEVAAAAASSVAPQAGAAVSAAAHTPLAVDPSASNHYNLRGMTALVTGGSSGIGLGVAQLLAQQGVRVAITSRTLKHAQKAAGDIDASMLAALDKHAAVKAAAAATSVPHHSPPPPISASLPVISLECDVRSSVSVDAAVDAAWNALGQRLDIVVHAAGVSVDALIVRTSDDAIDDVIQTNLVGATYLSRAVARKMMMRRKPPARSVEEEKAAHTAAAAAATTSATATPAPVAPAAPNSSLSPYPGGCLVFIGSVLGQHGGVGQSVYAASKSGLHGLTASLSLELASRSIRVHCVCPGFIDTDMTRSLNVATRQAILERIPSGLMGQAADVAHMVAFLASPQAKYCTGQIIAVDGGIRM